MKKHVLNAVLAFLMVFGMGITRAQTTNILQGTVKDAKGEAIVGATVQIKGTAIGTVTDATGNFAVSAPEGSKTLLIRYLGYKTKEVDIAKGDFNIALEEDALGLDELVVTALGIKKEKRALGYAVQDVSGDELTKSGNPDALSSLSGKVAGLQITTSSGQPGAAVDMQLRGPTSITGGNQPLIVVDGIPIDNSQNSTTFNATQGGSFGIGGDVNQNRGVDINPDDIASISVLKGPAATALYGIQAASGVVLITTKKGEVGGGKKFNVDISTSVTFDQVNKLQGLQNQWVQGSGGQFTPYSTRSWGALADTMYWDGMPQTLGLDKHGNLVGASDPTAQTKFTPYNNASTFFKTGVTTDNNFAISGGSDKGTFRLSVSNLYQSGIIPLSSLTKTTVSLSGQMAVGKKVVISGTASYINSLTSGDISGSNVSAPTFGIYRTPISFDNRNGITGSNTDPAMYIMPDGLQRSYTYLLGGGYSYFDNPYWSINENPYSAQTNRVIGNIQIVADPTDWLTFTERTGADVYSDRRSQIYALYSAGAPNDPYAGQDIEDQYFNRVINSDLIANLHHELAKDLNGSLFIGNNVYSSYSSNLLANGEAFTIPNFNNLSNAQTIIASNAVTKYLTTAIYGGINLDWKSQIYFAFTARNEWSSTLPADHRSFFFPSIDLGWVFTETAKMANNKWFPFGKLRVSWAEAGKDASPYSLQNTYAVPIISDSWGGGINFPFDNGSGPLAGFQQLNVLANPTLKAEITQSAEVGLDLRFMPNARPHFGGFNIDFTYYYSRTNNDIVQAAIAPSTGYAAEYLNTGQMTNQGIELVFGITPVKVAGFRWDMNINWSKNYNTVNSLAPGLEQLTLGGFQGSTLVAQPGYQYGMIYGSDFLRDGSGNIIIDNRASVNGVANPNYGFPLADPNQKIIGNPYPKWIGGWRNTFSYKGLSLSLLFDASFGAQIWDGTRGALTTYGRSSTTNNRDQTVTFKGVTTTLDANGNPIDGAGSTTNTIAANLGAYDPASGLTYGQEWYTGNGGGFGNIQSQFVEDASYFRLRELTLGYSFDKHFFKTKFIRGIDINFIARNVFLVTPYKGQDPDQALAGAGSFPAYGKGLDYFNLPSTRSYGFSVKFHF